MFKEIAIAMAVNFLELRGRIKPEGKPHLKKFTHLLTTDQKTTFSENIKILEGFESQVFGAEVLEELKGKNMLLLGNHSNEGPLKGYGQTFLVSYFVKEKTGKEIKWVFGKGSALEEFGRKTAENLLETISVNDGDGSQGVRNILKAMQNGETVGIYPEGKQGKVLNRGDPRAGKIILRALKNDLPVVCVSSRFANDRFLLTFNLLENSTLKTKNEQEAVDYAMNVIAQNLPVVRRGFYK